METRQASGKLYPPKSIYALLCGLLRIVHSNGTKYTNRSLWATATSRMFLNNVPEKTGHRGLAGLRAYENTTHSQEKAVTKRVSSSNGVFTDLCR